MYKSLQDSQGHVDTSANFASRASLGAATFACLVALASCGSGDDDGSNQSGAIDSGNLPVVDGGMATGRCKDENAKKIFVVTTDLSDKPYESHLFRFDPTDVSYTHIGELDCPGVLLRTMAVDRDGDGWGSMGDGSLVRINTETANCTDSGMEIEQHSISRYGMGYATLDETESEKLYITATGSDWSGQANQPYRKLAAINTETLLIDLIGDLEAPVPANMELTGTGDGRLFGMILDVRNLSNIIVSVDELNADTAETISSKTVPLDANSGFAFAHWGGDFWLFTEADDGKARVAQFDFDTGAIVQTVDTNLEVAGSIVGAGVSTCAPIRID
tara:strand:+ start:2552 stop:3547 length:996 start_codon:yes stop_codon:yes gene_type:complete